LDYESVEGAGGIPTEDRLIGPPGTGKTRVLAQAIAHNARVYGPENVVAVSHTRAAAAELVGRELVIPDENVGTLHAFAYRALGYPPLAETPERLREFADGREYQFSITADVEDLEAGVPEASGGDALLSEYSRRRNLCIPRELWPPDPVLRFAEEWEAWKQENGFVDFTDMIELAATETETPEQRPIVMCVDECQDTSRLQWKLLMRWAASPRCEKIVTAGDPDQAIFAWAGADPDFYMSTKPARRRVLEQSYRVPRAVLERALEWVRRIENRDDVTYKPRDADGRVSSLEANFNAPAAIVNLATEKMLEGKSVMVLASCGYMLKPTIEAFRSAAVPFGNKYRLKQGAWNPLLRRGEGSTVSALLTYLRPLRPGSRRIWTNAEACEWLDITKGLLRRGARKRLEELAKEDPRGDALRHLPELFADQDNLIRLLERDLNLLNKSLKAARKHVGEFAIRVVERYGPEMLERDPPVTIGTIHSVKGGEADVVVVCPDLSWQGFRYWASGGRQRDAIIRLFYVAMTRAREELYLCRPATSMAVPLQ